MIVVGLTGSIGMGKSTTAAMFAAEGAAVYDADAAVHRLYAPGGAAVAPITAAFPGVLKDGAIDRKALADQVLCDDVALRRLEALVHPLVAADRAAFLTQARAAGAQFVVLDLPLLFETGSQGAVDVVVVVTAPEDVQRARVLSRPGMSPEKLQRLLARQTADAEKQAGADYIIHTGQGLDSAREQVRQVLAELRQQNRARR